TLCDILPYLSSHLLFFAFPARHRDVPSFPTRRSSDLGDAALVARYRAGSAYHPWHPFWLFAEDEYGMTRAGAIIMAGARPGMLWQQLGCVVAATPSDALAQARGLVGAEARIVALPTYWSKPRIAFQVG